MVPRIRLLLHNIRSVHNVGSIFRTADATGVETIYISGHTPSPKDRFGHLRQDIAKVALGAERTVPWRSVDDPYSLVHELKREGVKIYGLEQDKRSIDYTKAPQVKDIILIIGNEVDGVEEKLLNLCDEILEIPMHGSKESLNVAVAAGIVLYALR